MKTQNMKQSPLLLAAFLSLGLLMLTGCSPQPVSSGQQGTVVFPDGYYPWATSHAGHYYYTMQIPSSDSIIVYVSDDPTRLSTGQRVCLWTDSSMKHIWSPELHHINNKWYVYFEADDGNTDNHQLYVLENAAPSPLQGQFQLRGPIMTNHEWNFGLHPTTIQVRGSQYLLWSGWQHRRSEDETQCIYIARMENPWTLASQRVLISQPDYEWERQWINPDGHRSNYPIFVNENPEAFLTADGRYVCVCYSASGIWTRYHVLGMLYARSDADLLNPASWTKLPEPQFLSLADSCEYWVSSNVSVVPSANAEETYLFYDSNWRDSNHRDHRDVRMKTIRWNEEGLPDFGNP